MSELITIGKTYGALLVGSLCASLLSGILIVQCFFYGRTYPNDSAGLKTFVVAIGSLDLLHNIAIWSSLWTWIVVDFGTPEKLDIIPIGIPLSIIVTALLTLLVHCFFAYRIYNLTTRRLLTTIPILFLSLLRLAAAMGTSHLMFKGPSLVMFKEHHMWIFSLGLALSSTVDVFVTTVMMSILRYSRASSLNLDTVLDRLILYTLESGLITAAATVISMICWLAMDNLIFLALHFIIAKLYANSVLSMLNCRQGLRQQTSLENSDGVIDFSAVPGFKTIGSQRHTTFSIPLSPMGGFASPNKQTEFRVDEVRSRSNSERRHTTFSIPLSPMRGITSPNNQTEFRVRPRGNSECV